MRLWVLRCRCSTLFGRVAPPERPLIDVCWQKSWLGQTVCIRILLKPIERPLLSQHDKIA
jgi:hypothetical protein